MACVLPLHYVADWCMLGLEIIFQCLVMVKRGLGCPLTGVAGPGVGGTLTVEATLGVVLMLWDMAALQ